MMTSVKLHQQLLPLAELQVRTETVLLKHFTTEYICTLCHCRCSKHFLSPRPGNDYLLFLSGSKTPRSSQKRVARMDKIMDDLRKERKSMTPGQKTMVPGHRPLPGLGGAHRSTPKTGMFGGSPGMHRSPGSALTPGGQRLPVATQGGPQTTPSTPLHRPPASSTISSSTANPGKVSAGAPLIAPGSGVQTSSTPGSNSSVSAHPSTPTTNLAQNPPPQTGTSDAHSTTAAQAVTVVQPTPGDGTPNRPALPKLKIRKDLIS